MKQSLFSIIVSMAAPLLIVNASAQDLPSRNQPPFKDSVKESPSDLSRLIDILMRTGDDDRMAPLTDLIGMTGDPPTKGKDFTLPRVNGKERRECAIVFSESSPTSVQNKERHPTCLYIQHKVVSGHDSESLYYRFSLDGKLEYASIMRGKFDDNHKPISGSGVNTARDIHSPEVQREFKSELAYWTKEWAKQEQNKSALTGSGNIPAPVKSDATRANAAPSAAVEAHRVDNSQEVPAARAPGSPY
jgi:hypothetical protein